VVRDIKTNLLLKRIDTEHAKKVKGKEERGHDYADPCQNEKSSNNFVSEKISIGVEKTAVGSAVGKISVPGSSGECSGNASPHSLEEVDANGINRVINLEFQR